MRHDEGSRRAVAFRDLLNKKELSMAARLVAACNKADHTEYSVPEDADLFFIAFDPQGNSMDSLLAVWHLGDTRDGYAMDEVAAFTRPENRRQGLFSSLFSSALPLLRPVLLFSSYENKGAREKLQSLGAVYEHSEYMMELDLNIFEQREPLSGHEVSRGGDGYELITETDEDGFGEELRTGYGEAHYRLVGARAYIYGVLVYSRFRGQGLGRKLMLLLLERIKGQGIDTAFLQVSSDNVPALKLYEELGFEQIQRLDLSIKKLSQPGDYGKMINYDKKYD